MHIVLVTAHLARVGVANNYRTYIPQDHKTHAEGLYRLEYGR